MSSRDWDKEMAKIDRQLEQVSDQALIPAPANATPAQKVEVVARREKTNTTGAVLRLLLAVALGVAMAFWPYETRCGAGVAAYLFATAVLTGAGVWSAFWSWRHRTARAHVLSLLIVLWGIVLATQEILPRTGYARPTLERPAGWLCS
jgi:hypothetical protein